MANRFACRFPPTIMVAVGRVEPPEVVAFGVPLPLQPSSTSDSAAAEATATMLCFFIMCAFPFGSGLAFKGT